MATREDRLSQFNDPAHAPSGTQLQVLAQDHVGTYALRFPCLCRDGVWKNAKTGEALVTTVVGWREWVG